MPQTTNSVNSGIGIVTQ